MIEGEREKRRKSKKEGKERRRKIDTRKIITKKKMAGEYRKGKKLRRTR